MSSDEQNLLQELGYIEYADNRVIRSVFPCQYCNRKYKFQTGLWNHTLTHEKKLYCSICKIKFAKLSDFKSHSAHIDKQTYTTSLRSSNNEIVPEKIRLRSALQVTGNNADYKPGTPSESYIEVKVDHQIEYRVPEDNNTAYEYMCFLCKKEFKEYEPLKIHMRLHTGFKPFACIQCNRKFMFLKPLKEHMQHHYDDPNPNLIIID